MRLAFRLAYLGTFFSGLQYQPDKRTVEGDFCHSCLNIGLFSDKKAAHVQFAGRTDRGVSAQGQVVAFSTEQPERAIKSLNKALPPEIWCTGHAIVPEDFNPRYHTVMRTYRYFLCEKDLDVAAMQQAASSFVGDHDFTRLARIDHRSPRRTVSHAAILESPDGLVFEISGRSFLWHMVRCMATALVQVGRGEMEPAAVETLLEGPPGHRLIAAPAEGLIFWDADCGVPFEPMTHSSHEAFREEQRCHHARMQQVMTALQNDF
jgi:tRNA pseudouridine38-40 synthase